MFFIILVVVIISGFITLIKFPNLTSKFTSKLPKFKFSRYFSNPKIKNMFRDREFFAENVPKLTSGSLFIVLGTENGKVYDLFSNVDEQGVKKKLEESEQAFELITQYDTNYLFVTPDVASFTKEKYINSRLRILISRLCKYRRQKHIDGIILVPQSSVYTSGKPTLSTELHVEIDIAHHCFQKFASFFNVHIPLYIFANSGLTSSKRLASNIFKHDEVNQNNDVYLGFSSTVSNRARREKVYEYYKTSLTEFITAFDAKTSQMLYNSYLFSKGLNSVYILNRVKKEIFNITENYLSRLFHTFEKDGKENLTTVTILNSILFSSFEGSSETESIKNLFKYLSTHRVDKIVFSDSYIRSKSRKNVIFLFWTFLFTIAGSSTLFFLNHHLLNKKKLYINKSVDKFNKFAEVFNANVSNIFPFGGENHPQSLDINTLFAVFDKYDAITSGNQKYFYEHITKLTNRKDIQTFVNEFDHIMSVLRTNKNDETKINLSFALGLRLKFRTPLTNESYANRIVNWSISTGQSTFGSQYGDYKKTEFVWGYANPFIFKIELPSPGDVNYTTRLTPVRTANNVTHVSTKNDSVTYSYQRDRWSLFRFIKDYDACNNAKIDCNTGALEFIVPLKDSSQMIFYSTLEIKDKNGKTVPIPVFPSIAPSFEKESAA